jgi:hypothetical protein
MTTRTARLVPWYVQVLDECTALTAKQEQCIFSARWKVRGVFNQDGTEKTVCKVHADMLALEGYQVVRIREKKVDLRRMQRQLRSVG